MKLVGQWFKLPPEHQRQMNALGSLLGLKTSEVFAEACKHFIGHHEKNSGFVLINRSNEKGNVENENRKSEENS